MRIQQEDKKNQKQANTTQCQDKGCLSVFMKKGPGWLEAYQACLQVRTVQERLQEDKTEI